MHTEQETTYGFDPATNHSQASNRIFQNVLNVIERARGNAIDYFVAVQRGMNQNGLGPEHISDPELYAQGKFEFLQQNNRNDRSLEHRITQPGGREQGNRDEENIDYHKVADVVLKPIFGYVSADELRKGLRHLKDAGCAIEPYSHMHSHQLYHYFMEEKEKLSAVVKSKLNPEEIRQLSSIGDPLTDD